MIFHWDGLIKGSETVELGRFLEQGSYLPRIPRAGTQLNLAKMEVSLTTLCVEMETTDGLSGGFLG